MVDSVVEISTLMLDYLTHCTPLICVHLILQIRCRVCSQWAGWGHYLPSWCVWELWVGM